MEIYEKIKFKRQLKGYSQEGMADKLNMSVNGYANIEHGDTDVQMSRLEQIAKILGVELVELFNFGEKNVLYLALAGDNNQFCWQNTDVSREPKELVFELQKSHLIIEQQAKEIAYLKEIIELMK